MEQVSVSDRVKEREERPDDTYKVQYETEERVKRVKNRRTVDIWRRFGRNKETLLHILAKKKIGDP